MVILKNNKISLSLVFRLIILTAALAPLFVTMSCAEKASSGDKVSIPAVSINCTTSHCRTNASPYVIVFITTSGCDSPDYGYTVSASTSSISCNGTSGCSGVLNSWVDANGAATTMPSGSYSICAWIDYNRDYPQTSGDTHGVLNNTTISSGTGTQAITTWTD